MEHADIPLSVNQVIKDCTDGRCYRVLWISADRSGAYWIETDGTKNIPRKISLPELEDEISDGAFEFVPDSWCPHASGNGPSLKWKQRRDRLWSLIEKPALAEPDIYDKAKRAALVGEAAQAAGEHPSNIYKLLGRYWKRGKVPDALLPDYGNVGKSRDIYKESSKRSGRPKKEGAPGKKLTLEDTEHFSDAVRKHYLTRDKNSLKSSYNDLLHDWYSIRQEDGTMVLRPADEIPSFNQYRNWYLKNRDVLEEVKKRDGQREYDLNHRPLTGKTETWLYGPGDTAQIDATIADIYLVSQKDRNAIVGRPAMYFVMDAATHMVTGMNVTLNSPSWQSEAYALRNCGEDKVAFCARYGIAIRPEEWPCRHYPRKLVGDRGELESKKADVLANSLGIQVTNTPPYRGDLKGIIEQHFRLVNIDGTNELPGRVQDDFGTRGSRDYRLEARLDIHQFTAIIIRCVLHYNNAHYMDGFTRSMEMRQLGVRPVPLELWNYGIRYRSGGLQTMDPDAINCALLPTGQASITEKGIYFHHLYYTCDPAEKENWYAAARTTGADKVTVSYDPNDMDCLYIHAGGRPVLCHLEQHLKMYKGLSEAETDRIHEADLAEKASYEHKELESTVNLREFIRRTKEEAQKQYDDSPESPNKTQKISSIRENRDNELELESRWQTQKSLNNRGIADMSSIMSGRAADMDGRNAAEDVSSDEIISRQIGEMLDRIRKEKQ